MCTWSQKWRGKYSRAYQSVAVVQELCDVIPVKVKEAKERRHGLWRGSKRTLTEFKLFSLVSAFGVTRRSWHHTTIDNESFSFPNNIDDGRGLCRIFRGRERFFFLQTLLYIRQPPCQLELLQLPLPPPTRVQPAHAS
jgi:hypothetical protein